jgi:hypothetical protein
VRTWKLTLQAFIHFLPSGPIPLFSFIDSTARRNSAKQGVLLALSLKNKCVVILSLSYLKW